MIEKGESANRALKKRPIFDTLAMLRMKWLPERSTL